MEYSVKDIYIYFRKVQAKYLNRPYRLPKDFEKFLEKMNSKNRKNLEEVTRNFSTKWLNINPELYFQYGFELYGKNFSYIKFLNKELMNFYIDKVKRIQFKEEEIKENVLKSVKFIKSFMEKINVKTISKYLDCIVGTGGLVPAILIHWRRKKIDPFTMIFLMNRYKEKFKEFDENYINFYLGKEFIRHMYKWRYRLIERPEIFNLLKKEISSLE